MSSTRLPPSFRKKTVREYHSVFFHVKKSGPFRAWVFLIGLYVSKLPDFHRVSPLLSGRMQARRISGPGNPEKGVPISGDFVSDANCLMPRENRQYNFSSHNLMNQSLMNSKKCEFIRDKLRSDRWQHKKRRKNKGRVLAAALENDCSRLFARSSRFDAFEKVFFEKDKLTFNWP